MPGTISYVDEEKAKEVSRNPDWVCRFCDCLNPDSSSICISCGASRTAENLDYFENRSNKQKLEEETETTTQGPEIVLPKGDNPEPEPVVRELEPEKEVSTDSHTFKSIASNIAESVGEFFIDNLPIIGVIALIALIIGGIIWLATPKTRTVTVDHTYWDYSIEIEKYQTVDESGWSLPTNARLHETRSEIYTYEQVLDHYENKTRQVAKQRLDHYDEKVVGYKDLGNGYFEEITERVPVYETYYETEHYQEPVYRSQPVYKTKYYYEIDKWLHDRNLETSGIDCSPYWADTSDLKSDERTGTQTSEYSFSGTDYEGNTKIYDVSYSDWSDLKAGDEITIKVSVFGNVKSIEYHS